MVFDKAAEVVEKLNADGRKITFTESCTGGLAAAMLVSVPNASEVFDGSLVTYAPEMKTKLADVPTETIEKYGVVSETVAGLMAKGGAKKLGSDVGVGITGFAGPSGGTENAPVGTVCFGFFTGGTLKTCTKHFGDIGRNEVREKSVEFVFSTLCELL